eukprot:5702173-Pyramimonas_sp.AAC.1
MDEHVCIIICVSKWCALALSVREISNGIFSVVGNVEQVFVTDMLQWVVIPYEVCTPAELHAMNVGASSGIAMRQNAPPRSLVRHMLHHKASNVDKATAFLIACSLALVCDNSFSRDQLISLIAGSALVDEDADDFVQRASALYSGENCDDDGDLFGLSDPAAQAVFEFGGDSTIIENQDESFTLREPPPACPTAATRRKMRRRRGRRRRSRS